MEQNNIKQMLDTVTGFNYIATTNKDIWVICPNCNGDGVVFLGEGHPYIKAQENKCGNCIDGKVKVNIKVTRVLPVK